MRIDELREDRRGRTEAASTSATAEHGARKRRAPHRARLRGRWFAAVLLGLLGSPGAQAAVITVDTTTTGVHGDGLCSLTEAIDNANVDANDGTVYFGPIDGVVFPTHPDCAAGSGADTIVLEAGATYTYTAPNQSGETGAASYRFWWYGPEALPAIASDITIEGNGATITRSGSTPFRFFYVAADPANPNTDDYTSPRAGRLTLENLTLRNGLAKGGNSNTGGSGAGMGGAIFSQGAVTLEAVTLDHNTAQGGSSAVSSAGNGGGGLGEDAPSGSSSGGGFGGGFQGIGASGGHGNFSTGQGGGGAGFRTTEDGNYASNVAPGDGGGPDTGLAGYGKSDVPGPGTPMPGPGSHGGDGGGGGGDGGAVGAAHGGDFGAGGHNDPSAMPGDFQTDGGGGVGGGGSGYVSGCCYTYAGGGGFGAGGGGGHIDGFGSGGGGFGGFGGGGGGGDNGLGASSGGFAGGNGFGEYGGGGAGLGGAVFNMQGTLTLTNSTLAFNTAAGGTTNPSDGSTGGLGLGGAVFNLSGMVSVSFSTLARNTADAGGAIYNLVFDSVTARIAKVRLFDSLLADSVDGGAAAVSDLLSNKPVATTGTMVNLGTATVASAGSTFVTSSAILGGADALPTFITTDPKLATALAANGATNRPDTLALLPTSPAIDSVQAGNCTTLDERGFVRDNGGTATSPGDPGAACDSGAYDTLGVAPTPGPHTITLPACSGGVGDPLALIDAIDLADDHNAAHYGPDTIVLPAGCTYTFTGPNQGGDSAPGSYRFWWYGPSALPAIASDITLVGNGATITRSGATPFRFFYVGADPANPDTDDYTSPGAGHLTLENLTLSHGLAKGGDSLAGGGGAGLGGAIFNQGMVTLESVTLDHNTAQGGTSGVTGLGDGGGGLGEDGSGNAGGGFGGGFSGIGAAGGAPASGFGGAGAGFRLTEQGGDATSSPGHGGGPATGLAGNGHYSTGGDGGGGGGSGGGTAGGAFGAPNTSSASDGGGGVGSGGGHGAGGGFGGGGGRSLVVGGTSGGFGGGGGGYNGSDGGFGGGVGASFGNLYGGGGGGMGGAVFNMQGTLTLTNSTLAFNSAAGGTTNTTGGAGYGRGLGGAIFNLSGTVDVAFSTLARNTADDGGAIFNLVYDSITARSAAVTLTDSLLADSTIAPRDLLTDKRPITSAGTTNLGTALVTNVGGSIVVSSAVDGNASALPTFATDDPLLDSALAANGVPNAPQTLALPTGSPAVDAATSGACPATDERGVARPQGAACDLGAYEALLPAVGLTPSTLTFGVVLGGQTSPAQTVVLENTGGADLSLGALSLGGAESADFSLSNDTCSGQVIAPAATCSFDVSFTPTATGTRSAHVDVPSNAASSSDTVLLSGTGRITSFTVSSATGTGTISGEISGGGPVCGLSTASATTAAAVAGGPPPQVVFPHGLVNVNLEGCTPGSTVTITLTFPAPLSVGAREYKYGPTPGDSTPHWYVLPADVTGAVVSYDVTDGGQGDDDLSADGTIHDPGGPGVTVPVVAIPTLGRTALVLLALLLAAVGAWWLWPGSR